MMIGRFSAIEVTGATLKLLSPCCRQRLQATPVIAFVAEGGRPNAVLDLLSGVLSSSQKDIRLVLPLYNAPAIVAAAYDEGASRIGTVLEQGQDVVLLCEQDPLRFAPFRELFRRLGRCYPVAMLNTGTLSRLMTAAGDGADLPDLIEVIGADLGEDSLAVRLQKMRAAVITGLSGHLATVRKVILHLKLERRALCLTPRSNGWSVPVPLTAWNPGDAEPGSMIMIPPLPAVRRTAPHALGVSVRRSRTLFNEFMLERLSQPAPAHDEPMTALSS